MLQDVARKFERTHGIKATSMCRPRYLQYLGNKFASHADGVGLRRADKSRAGSFHQGGGQTNAKR